MFLVKPTAQSSLALLVLASLALSGCASTENSPPTAGRPCRLAYLASLPLEIRNHALFTHIRINKQDAIFLFDTGGSLNLVSNKAAARLGLPTVGHGENTIRGLGGIQRVDVVQAQDVSLGAASGRNLYFFSVPSAYGGKVDGILGMPFIRGFDIDIDLPGHRIDFYTAVEGCHTPASNLQQPLFPVTMWHDLGAVSPIVDVIVNGVKLRAMVDTGAQSMFIFRHAAYEAGLISSAAPIAKFQAHGIGPNAVESEVRIAATLTVGDLTMKNVPFVIGDTTRIGSYDMLLGFDFVSKIHVWISQSSQTLIMQFPPRPSPFVPEPWLPLAAQP